MLTRFVSVSQSLHDLGAAYMHNCCYELRLKQTCIVTLEKASAAAASAAHADTSEVHNNTSKSV